MLRDLNIVSAVRCKMRAHEGSLERVWAWPQGTARSARQSALSRASIVPETRGLFCLFNSNSKGSEEALEAVWGRGPRLCAAPASVYGLASPQASICGFYDVIAEGKVRCSWLARTCRRLLCPSQSGFPLQLPMLRLSAGSHVSLEAPTTGLLQGPRRA